jgi:hypothetical protein
MPDIENFPENRNAVSVPVARLDTGSVRLATPGNGGAL